MSSQSKSLWGGRFTDSIDSTLADLNRSLDEDRRLFAQDLDGSKAYAEALHVAQIITEEEYSQISNAIEMIRFSWVEGAVKFENTDEDVHTVNERLLVKICGSTGEKLHTGRSRNDQVVTDVNLWMKRAIHEMILAFGKLLEVILSTADKYRNVIMPGYTHLQRAQPVLTAHWLLSHAFALREDCSRFKDLFDRVDVLPLGSGALAGNPLRISREMLAYRLGFSRITQNSMHAVGDRDNIAEFNFVASLSALHLSRFAEDLIIYCTKEFGFIRISDEYSTGSSLMPQKRNPDSLELVRGIAGSIFGSMSGFMMTLKGLPSTYNKDLQLDKKSLFNSFDSLMQVVKIMSGVVQSMKVIPENCEKALSPDLLATDWAYYLVRKGIPFRTAHHLVGKCVAKAESRGIGFLDLSLEELQEICKEFDVDFEQNVSYLNSVESYNVTGGTGSCAVGDQFRMLRSLVKRIGECQQINDILSLDIMKE